MFLETEGKLTLYCGEISSNKGFMTNPDKIAEIRRAIKEYENRDIELHEFSGILAIAMGRAAPDLEKCIPAD